MGKVLGLVAALLALGIVQGCGDDDGHVGSNGGGGNEAAGAGGEGGTPIAAPNVGGAGASGAATTQGGEGGGGGSPLGGAGGSDEAGEAGAGGEAGEGPLLPDAIPERDESDLPQPEGKVGFITLEPRTFKDIYEVKNGGTSVEARMFYRFIPADEDAKNKPVFVFFNGGPGYTSMLLYTFGTGPLTLNAEAPNDPPTANPNSFSKLGNLLYIDARGAGFSYGVTADPSSESERIDGLSTASMGSMVDAADFVRVVLRVLKQQPALENNRVVLVGESYGGARAPLMLNLLLYPDTPLLHDEALGAELQSHYEDVFRGVDSALFGPGLFSLQFGWQVLIEPYLGIEHDAAQNVPAFEVRARMAAEHGISVDEQQEQYCWDDVRRLNAYCDALDPAIVNALLDPTSFEKWMGSAPEAVSGLTAATRTGAFRLGPLVEGLPLEPAAWRANSGELPEWDRYFSPFAPYFDAHSFDTVMGASPVTSFAFVAAARYASTLITNAAYDAVVRPDAIVPALRHSQIITGVVSDVAYDGADPEQPTERFYIDYPQSVIGPATRRSVYLPTYASSGHVVTLSESAKLFSDVSSFLDETASAKAH